ncbi:uncharacterized protein LOC111377874 [Olea europaea var. sylvestris]|uniref:uncharacterized protein LOC111377874 n=1 Tax=Olea europaea var. sylvestris TaxID=158386 RepID=UPI000C1D1FBF|nr:uncharacterized protein LOC111377874 [Olea europaea var. sylvestris]XP_022856907.1 uncharacterized protein LOC111377874 [Olea europaea var. sylvestris]
MGKKRSSNFSKMRTTQKLLHTMGRKGYSCMAHDLKRKNLNIKGLRTRVWTHGHLRKDGKPINEAVAETLRKIEDCAESISDTPAENSIRDDATARILGPERRGRVRGLGLGVTPSKVDGNVQSSEKVRELESKLQTQSVRMEALEEKVEALLKLSQSQQGSGMEGGITPVENAKCQLLHWYMFEEEEIVGEGKIASIDPSAKVHHMPLGRDCWKVWVEEVYMSQLPLYRPTDEFQVLSEAMRSTVAWPKSCVRLI